jgi:cyclic beta-1,2-glucan synthetase
VSFAADTGGTISPDRLRPADDVKTAVDQARAAGCATARALGSAEPNPSILGSVKRHIRSLRRDIYSGIAAHPAARPHRHWLAENRRLIAAAVKESQELAGGTHHLPAVAPNRSAPVLRVVALANAFLDYVDSRFDTDRFVAFIHGAQDVRDLTLGEIWAIRPALQLGLIERIIATVTTGTGDIPLLIGSLRALADARWNKVFAQVNVVDRVLARDPAAAYDRMDDDSQQYYRSVVSELAERSGRSERNIAEEAVALACAAARATDSSRRTERRCHVGYYLVDRGVPALRDRIGYRSTLRQSVIDRVRSQPTRVYFATIAIATAAILLIVLYAIGNSAHGAVAAALLLIPATHAAIQFANAIATALLRPRPLPKLDFADGVPDECATVVAVPALLLTERHVRDLVMDMEIRYLANRDANIRFALMTDSRDSRERPAERDEVLRLCEQLVRELNERYGADGHTPFYLLHRFRAYNPSEARWIGWERKRGKLLDLNQLLRGVRDRFPVKVGNVPALRCARYVIVLDADTEMPRDAARRLVGAMAHPLNRAVIDPATRTVVEGYGILQPRVSISTGSAAKSWLATLYSGETGFDIYTRAVSDVYQDLFGEGIFTGKGIYEVDAFRESLEHRFPANTLLSHDLIEGLFARAGLVSDIELVDDYPSQFNAYCRRRHRWMRGDWQILRWLVNRVPDGQRRPVDNPLGAISRWKILDNLRRTLVEPATLALLLVVWFALPHAGAWTMAAVLVLLAPSYWSLLFAAARAPWLTPSFRPWAFATLTTFLRSHLLIALHFAYLLHDALLSVDAIVRALARMFLTGRRLLEWETAAEASLRTRGATDRYLKWSPVIAAGITALLGLARPESLPVAAPLLFLWISTGWIGHRLNQPPPAEVGDLDAADVRFLREHAARIWRFFSTCSSRRNHWLIPDSVRADGAIDERISPTNLGMLLNARIAAVHFGYLTLPEFVSQTRRTLGTIQCLPRYRGHLLNWYDSTTLQPLEPRFVSTVDSGNLAAALWTLKQTALAFARQPPQDHTLWDGIADLARLLSRDTDAAARALGERVLKTRPQWRQSLPELEALVRHYASSAHDEARTWAGELVVRLRQARAWCEGGVSPAVASGLAEIAQVAHALVADMDFALLYDERRQVLSVGCDAASGEIERSAYDLLASEARIASFVAIAKGDIPQESWFHLGRLHVATGEERVLVSWTGTLFEYLMPALWFRHRPRTIMHDSMCAAVRVQRKFARRRNMPWGFSESGFIVPDSADYGYAPCGQAELALKPLDPQTLVVSPYSSYLALLVDPRAAIENLRLLARLGCVGRYGFFEALDYSRGNPHLVRSWMSHHQGMSLLAAAEVLLDARLKDAFHSEAQVRATERLLEERVPRTVVPDEAAPPCVLWPEESPA